jgi:alpha-ketoglutarate-dependent taurine dioxygenase
MQVENLKPLIGSVVRLDGASLVDRDVVRRCNDLLEERGVLVFPQINLTDEEQLAFTDMFGSRVNFTSQAPGGNQSLTDVYTVTLDPEINMEPEYVLGTFFWHMDGLTNDIPPPKASLLSARRVAPQGGHTEFASTYAAYEHLPEEDKAEVADLRVLHTVTAAVREVAPPETLDPRRRTLAHEHPLVWTRKSGRKSLLIGYTADEVVGKSKAEGRALLARLLEWTAQPDFTYRHRWREGDLVVWDNTDAIHRVIPYAAESGRMMHRTSVAGIEVVS